MRLLTIIALVLLSITTVSFSTDKKLIADETWLTTLNSQMKIETSNETIKQKIEQFGGYVKVCATQKKDRKGMYWFYSYYYPRESFKMPPL